MISDRRLLTLIASLFVASCTPKIMTGYYDQIQADSALSPHWIQNSPTNILTPTAVWSHSNSPLLSSQKLQFFSDGNCVNPAGPPVNLGSTSQQSYLFSGKDGETYTFQVISTLSDGFQNISNCSNPISIITTLPNATSLIWSQASPVNANQATLSWTKSTSPILYDQKIQFFSDGSCTVGYGPLIDLSSSSVHTKVFQALNGTYSYKITSLDAAGNSNTSNCSNAIVIDDLASATLSSFTAIPASIPADGTSTSTIGVTILDSQSLPIFGKVVSVNSSRGSIDTVTALSATTDASGRAFFTLKSNKIGLPTLSVLVASDGVTLNQVGHLTLVATGAIPQTDYQAWLANLGKTPGSNSSSTSSFKDLTQAANTNNATLYSFNYTTASGWAGDGSLLTSGALGPNRLVLDGTSNYVDFGASIHSNSSFSFETWIRPEDPTISGSVILSTVDSSNRGFVLFQQSDGSGKVSLAPAGVISVYSQAVLADSPLIYWRSDETSGTNASDASGNGISGTYSGSYSLSAPALITGSGTSVNYTNGAIRSNNSFASPTQFSIECWFRGNSGSSGLLIGFVGPHNEDREIFLASSGQIQFFYSGAPAITTAATYNDSLIHHVVGTLSNTTLSLYVDDLLINQTSASTGINYTGNWSVGMNSSQGAFSGLIDEVAIYGTVLSAARIQAHYLAGTENCISQTPLSSDVWNHLAGVFNGSSNTASLYLNGNQQCTIPLSGINYSGSGSDLTAGSSPSQTNFWSGAIASMKTYAQALTSTLIQQNYAATAATFDIRQLGAPSPIVWLRADSIQGLSDGASVSTWPDSSSNGNNATQGTSANQPIWKKNVLNGYPVVRFNGSTYLSEPSVFPVSNDYSVILVMKATTPTSNFFGSNIGSNAHNVYLSNYQFLNEHNSSAFYYYGGFITSNTYFILSTIYSYSLHSSNYFINGIYQGNGGSPQINTDPTLLVGAGANSYLQGDIAEAFLFGSTLSTNDRSLIETYLNAKYGIF